MKTDHRHVYVPSLTGTMQDTPQWMCQVCGKFMRKSSSKPRTEKQILQSRKFQAYGRFIAVLTTMRQVAKEIESLGGYTELEWAAKYVEIKNAELRDTFGFKPILEPTLD